MFTFDDLRKTQYFQDVYEEGYKEGLLDSVPYQLELGETPEQIAQNLNLPIEKIEEVIQKFSKD